MNRDRRSFLSLPRAAVLGVALAFLAPTTSVARQPPAPGAPRTVDEYLAAYDELVTQSPIDYSAVLRLLEQATAAHPNEAFLHQQYGLFSLDLAHVESARAALDAARRLEPGNTETLLNLSAVELWTGNFDDAIVHLDALEAVAPDYEGLEETRRLIRQGAALKKEECPTLSAEPEKFVAETIAMVARTDSAQIRARLSEGLLSRLFRIAGDAVAARLSQDDRDEFMKGMLNGMLKRMRETSRFSTHCVWPGHDVADGQVIVEVATRPSEAQSAKAQRSLRKLVRNDSGGALMDPAMWAVMERLDVPARLAFIERLHAQQWEFQVFEFRLIETDTGFQIDDVTLGDPPTSVVDTVREIFDSARSGDLDLDKAGLELETLEKRGLGLPTTGSDSSNSLPEWVSTVGIAMGWLLSVGLLVVLLRLAGRSDRRRRSRRAASPRT